MLRAGQINLHTGTGSDLSVTSSNSAALAALGLGGGVSQARGTGPSPLNGLSLSIGATGGGTATTVTFGGTGAGHVNTLNDLNAALASNNLQATLAQDGTLTITTSNDAASAQIGTITGSAAASGQLFFGKAGSAPVLDPTATAFRNNLVDQYNNILNQITTTAQDASFNGINLLGGDTLKLTFNETGKSTLNIHRRQLQRRGPRPGDVEHRRLQGQRLGPTRSSAACRLPAARFARRLRPSVRTCRSCRSVRTSRRT